MDDLLMNPWSSPATNFRPDRDECTMISPLDSAFYEGEPSGFFQQPSIQADPLLARLVSDPYLSNSSQPQEILAAGAEAEAFKVDAAPGFNWTSCSMDVLPDLQAEGEFMSPSSLTNTSLQATAFNLGSSATSQCCFLDEKKAPPAASSYECFLGPPSKVQRTSLCEQANGIQGRPMAEFQQQQQQRDPCIVEAAVEPQSVAARQRRKRISERVRSLEKLIPGGAKMDTASMLDEAIRYVKFLQMQVWVLEQLGETAPPSSAAASSLVLSEELQEVLFRKRCLVASARQCNSSL